MQCWLNLFVLNLVDLSFPILVFSIGIKTFYTPYSSIFRHLDFNRAIQMISCSFKRSGLLKPANYVFKYLKYRNLYPIIPYTKQITTEDMALKLGCCSCELKQSTTKETEPVSWFWYRHGFI